MALKTLIQFPIFAPPNPTTHHHHHHRPATEVRFSRWNNANAQKFIRQDRTQQDIEDELRRLKRFNSADKIITTTTTTATTDTFRSTGTPSTPSLPSIPGKSSKYSKNPRQTTHPAFRPISRVVNVPTESQKAETGVKVSDDGVSYVLPNAPFAFQYSYTETPKAKPLKLREPPIAPFGPSTIPRPWTGRKPLPPSKKKLEFDSFRLPPPHKKGVKPVQSPGPFLPGSGPKYVKSREQILGEPLTKEEIDDLVKGCMKSSRQLNMGRDGLTHNMLDNIHALWKRKRVCKIKCKGVCTVDMRNVHQQLEEKTGGKIIYSRGGVIYLFRGRNYNYKTRPLFPLMLWKPVTPVYPRLIQRAPEGLTLEEASEMRKKGRSLTPICKLGKNGVYCDLVKNVREAFEACELVRINCQGMNGSDYRKIGAKLKDLVPCVLISFEREHILMWRGRDWKSSFPKLVDDSDAKNSEIDSAIPIASHLEGQVVTALSIPKSGELTSLATLGTSTSPMCSEDVLIEEHDGASTEAEDQLPEVNDMSSLVSDSVTNTSHIYGSEIPTTLTEPSIESHASHSAGSDNDESTGSDISIESVSSSENQLNHLSVDPVTCSKLQETSEMVPNLSDLTSLSSPWTEGVQAVTCSKLQETSEMVPNLSDLTSLSSPWTEGVLVLWKEAIESGTAIVVDDSSLDSDIVYRKAVALAKSAPPGPVFRHRRRKVVVQKFEKQKTEDSEVKEVVIVVERRGSETKSSTNHRVKDAKKDFLGVVPKGSLRVDELAKLLA
ncbi:CRS2-associated factor 1, chloroplastic [Camellia sinensis]|uniref:CRM domain-containing protein n=1 Tax=Camellia sinensis var. sinensis TaxID=542762 RepID=A0A4S4DSD6_CAMSN|nr:CRS2-associated factor 1, chloroplastic [Camellia sinensis]THG06121.1 hypothetical protein TEA_002010 [Camellia sinensis var. sinensis]